jgi:hypothetical protein
VHIYGNDGQSAFKNPTRDVIIANLPQVALSVAYLAYNGLFTRMLSEREWSHLSLKFQPLRVSRPKGLQKESYRLQLPMRWSIPLMVTSGVLHWLISNCIYVSFYTSRWLMYPFCVSPFRPSFLFFYVFSLPATPSLKKIEANTYLLLPGYPPLPPYNEEEIGTGLRFSTKAILVTFIISLCLSMVPLVLSRFSLPGHSVLATNNSAVISAACHSTPAESSSLTVEMSESDMSKQNLLPQQSPYDMEGDQLFEVIDRAEHLLTKMATQEVKWGVVFTGSGTVEDPGHLSFGSMDHNVKPPVEGMYYAGEGREDD